MSLITQARIQIPAKQPTYLVTKHFVLNFFQPKVRSGKELPQKLSLVRTLFYISTSTLGYCGSGAASCFALSVCYLQTCFCHGFLLINKLYCFLWTARGSNPGRCERLSLVQNCLDPHIPLFNGFRYSFPGLERPGRGLDHSTPFSAEVKNEWSHIPSWRGNGQPYYTVLLLCVTCLRFTGVDDNNIMAERRSYLSC